MENLWYSKKISPICQTEYQSPCKKPIPGNDKTVFNRCKYNPGRPRKVTERDERKILRMIPKLRRDIGNSFTWGKIKTEAGVSHISNRTVRHHLNKHGYYFRHSRKKGLVTAKDRLNCVTFSRKVLSRLTSEFWTEGISFYLEVVGFVHKFFYIFYVTCHNPIRNPIKKM